MQLLHSRRVDATCRFWADGPGAVSSAQKTIIRQALLEKLHQKRLCLKIASDCTGAGAPEQAWASVRRVLVAFGIPESFEIEETFGSEHPKAHHCHKYIKQNLRVLTLYADFVARTVRCARGKKCSTVFTRTPIEDGDIFDNDKQEMPAPGTIDNYSVGFERQALSGRNGHGERLDLSVSPDKWLDKHGVSGGTGSQRTLMASACTIKQLLPRTVLIENVGSCPMLTLLEYLRRWLAMYQWWGNYSDAADFGSTSARYRLSICGFKCV